MSIFIPEEDETYYYIGCEGSVVSEVFNKLSTIDSHNLAIGNCYRTKEDAERARDRQYALVELMDFYNEYSGEERTLFDLVFNLEVNDEFVNLAKEKLGEEKLKLIMEV
mgnify:CR=1 FL=1